MTGFEVNFYVGTSTASLCIPFAKYLVSIQKKKSILARLSSIPTAHLIGPTDTSSYGTRGTDETKRADSFSICTAIGTSAIYGVILGNLPTSYTRRKTRYNEMSSDIIMPPLAEKTRIAIPRTLQPWFADDSASSGSANDNATCI